MMSDNKYALASNVAAKESNSSDQAASMPFYLLFDRSGNSLKALRNPFSDTDGRAWVHCALSAAGTLVYVGATNPPSFLALRLLD